MASETNPWGVLYAEVAPNAILNTGGRAGPVRCHPGTRKEIISKAETWMESGYLDDRRIFWLSGPAGAGKSAIVQTLAERCIQRKDPMANFFFFRADASRAHSRPVFATIFHQLFDFFPSLKPTVNDLIRQDRLIFKRSLRDQVAKLVDEPIRAIRHALPEQPPVVLFIDGLDECDSRQGLDTATKSEQINLLNVLHQLVARPDSVFIALVASRVESHIQMAFNTIGSFKDSIYLNEDYQPDNDIQLFITEELDRIKRVHPLGQFLNASWPSEDIIKAIVSKSPAQFIYVTTVARFVANSSQSPAISINMVLNVRPANRHSPFAEIDAIYTFILSQCKNWAAVRDVLAADHLFSTSIGTTPIMSALGYSKHDILSFFSDLSSVIQVSCDEDLDVDISFYHASFRDFMYDLGRAGRYHIDLVNCANDLAPGLILGISHHYTMVLTGVLQGEVSHRSDPPTTSLTHLPTTPWDVNVHHVQQYFHPRIQELYSNNQILCDRIGYALRQWGSTGSIGTDIDELPGHPSPSVNLEPHNEQSSLLSVDSPAEDTCLLMPNLQPQPKRKKFEWFTRYFC